VPVGTRVFVGARVLVGVRVLVEVRVLVGVRVLVWVCVSVGVRVLVAAAAQIGMVMVLVSRVTLPFRARARPIKLALFNIWMESSARIFPMNEVVVLRVTDVAALHHTLHRLLPVRSSTTTDEPVDVMIVVGDLKIQMPDPVRCKIPVKEKPPASTQ
jgi:hypothetical protein